jgi:hypothetical protein
MPSGGNARNRRFMHRHPGWLKEKIRRQPKSRPSWFHRRWRCKIGKHTPLPELLYRSEVGQPIHATFCTYCAKLLDWRIR